MPPKRGRPRKVRPVTPPPPEPEPISPNTLFLRSQEKWAAFTHFIWLFDHAIGVPDYTIQTLEDDLARTTFVILPRLMHKLLYTTTLDRRINAETWPIYLRKQHIKRQPESNPFGSEDEPIEWADVSIQDRMDVMLRISDWFFGNPTRVRQLMNTDDNLAYWRAEPFAYDAKGNAYWLIGGERLWIQRNKKPVRPKKAMPKRKKKAAPTEPAEPPRRRGRPPKPVPPPASPTAAESRASSTGPRRSKRAAVLQASQPAKRRRMIGTRMSSRLHAHESTEWQEVPDEWLDDGRSATSSTKGKAVKSTTAGSDDSDLTELSDGAQSHTSGDEDEASDEEAGEDGEEDDGEKRKADQDEVMEEVKPGEKHDQPLSLPQGEEDQKEEKVDASAAEATKESENVQNDKLPEAPEPKPGDPSFKEWEQICQSIEEYEKLAEQFQGSTNSSERTLYRKLQKEIIPWVKDVYAEREKALIQIVQEVEDIGGRKRSSRLAAVEAERKRQEIVAAELEDEDPRSSRARRAEARENLQMTDRERREMEREERRKERELQELKEREEEELAEMHAEREAAKQVAEFQPIEYNSNGRPIRKTRTAVPRDQVVGDEPVNQRESWELACEICQKKGWNIDDGRVITACEKCGKWQHTECHDRADEQAGRPKRDWNADDFVCKACQRKQSRNRGTPTATASGAAKQPPKKPAPQQLQPTPPAQAPAQQVVRTYAAHQQAYGNGHYPATGQPHAPSYPPLPGGASTPATAATNAAGLPYSNHPYASQYAAQYSAAAMRPQYPPAQPYPNGPPPGAYAQPQAAPQKPHAYPQVPAGYPPYPAPQSYPRPPPINGQYAPPPGGHYWPGQPYTYAPPPNATNASGAYPALYPNGAAPPPPGDPNSYRYIPSSSYNAAQLLAYQARPLPQAAQATPAGSSAAPPAPSVTGQPPTPPT